MNSPPGPDEASPAGEARLPVTIVTGFLGSGKTTLVNHILAHRGALRTAVMVNEFGEIGIDGALILAGGDDIFELAQGCICCSINNDLVAAIFRIAGRRGEIDHLVVETTGLADPLPVVLTFLRSEFRDLFRVDGVIATVDAENFRPDLIAGKAATDQLGHADIVVLNKCDLARPERADEVEQEIRSIAGAAPILRARRGRVALPLILGVGGHRGYPDFSESHNHLQADGFEAVSFTSERRFSADRFQKLLEDAPGLGIFRAKGILAIADSEDRHVFHLVGRRFTLDPAAASGPPGSRLVLLGRGLDRALLHERLAACLEPGGPAHSGAGISSDQSANSNAAAAAIQVTQSPRRK